jgi:anti-sigma factor RsiW
VTTENLTCQQLVEVITDYVEGTMPAAERERFEAHLAICPGCVTYLIQMRQTIAAVGRLRADMIDSSAQADLLVLFREWKSGG